MLRAAPDTAVIAPEPPTLWGLDQSGLHDRFWASQSVCVVRPGGTGSLPRGGAELFLLTDARTLGLFSLKCLVRKFYWAQPTVSFIRLHYASSRRYREEVVTDNSGRFTGFARRYGIENGHVARLALTRDRRIAQMWQATDGSPAMWRQFRRQTRRMRRQSLRADGTWYDRFSAQDLSRLMSDLIRLWPDPSMSVDGIRQVHPNVWAPRELAPPDACFLGPAWIGFGRAISGQQTVLGPAALWDLADARLPAREMRWEHLDPTTTPSRRLVRRAPTQWRRITQRAFDILFALAVLAVTLPLYPLIMLAIWLEDGGPFLFSHRRETLGGRVFGCMKFRSMRKDADQLKVQLKAQNKSDGPQFFIENDPRVTRVGRFLRRTNLDELPQFINVLRGDMAVVGPRPSPRAENQCCPAWREARLSVRPGVTGLWQVNRTRREGLDFQEWIKFDIEYVERASWRLDLLIIFKTLRLLAGHKPR